jgi:NitT/TauT family transport system permease protein
MTNATQATSITSRSAAGPGRFAWMRWEYALTVLVAVVMLALWEFLPALAGIPSFILPPASMVWHEFLRALVTERLVGHVLHTGFAVLIGFALGSLLGMVMGYTLGLSRRVEFILSPYILGLQIAPKVAFAPLFVMWLGYTIYPQILVAVLIVFFPVMVNVLVAVQTVDADLINLARSCSATRSEIFWKIQFPSSMPPLFSGLRIASTLAVIGVTVGELVGGNTGLGYVLVYGEGQANTPLVFVAITLLTLVGMVAYFAVIFAERRVLHYMPKPASHGI